MTMGTVVTKKGTLYCRNTRKFNWTVYVFPIQQTTSYQVNSFVLMTNDSV